MVSKNQLKLIKSLHQKKYRNQRQLFFVEGIKTVNELLGSDFKPYLILATASQRDHLNYTDVLEISEPDLKSISALHTPNGVLGVFEIPEQEDTKLKGWVLALDSVQDPGNLGTIIRLCDWFGIQQLLCSHGTVDCYNPKTLQATMGSITRVQVRYTDLKTVIQTTNIPVYGAFMDGESMHQADLPNEGILVLGNEANGISGSIAQLVAKKVSIPQFGEPYTESLNVATATAILLAQIRRPK